MPDNAGNKLTGVDRFDRRRDSIDKQIYSSNLCEESLHYLHYNHVLDVRHEPHRERLVTIANMATSKTPKSILKKPTYPATAPQSRADRDKEVALYHANLLQHRKDLELEILLSTETLIDYPLASAPYNASNPSPADALQFKTYLRLFQPSDYDALILERNINEHCGYTLCPNKKATDGAAGKYRLVGKYGKAKDFKVVEKAEVEKWCSEACAKRALYVRVQLSESPAWERENYGADVDLLDEPKSQDEVIADGLENMNLSDADAESKLQDAADLALERGDQGFAARKGGLVDVEIKEKDVQDVPQPPSLNDEHLSERLDSMHLSVEGHTIKFGTARHRRHHGAEEDDDEQDTDWRL